MGEDAATSAIRWLVVRQRGTCGAIGKNEKEILTV